jgi:RNA polymerase sigma-70 factor (ECF subfamily)
MVADTDAFTRAYRAEMPAVFRYLLRATGGDRALAEDLTQATFLAAARRFAAGDPACVGAAWLRVVARNGLIDHVRRARREEARLPVLAGPPGPGPGARPDDGPADEALAALRRLPPAPRLALALRYLDDLPVAEVADLMGRSVRATESLLARGRAALRQAYDEESCDAG